MKKKKTFWQKGAYWLVGGRGDTGSRLGKLTTYFILTGMGFVFLYPLLYMLSVSFMDTPDLVDATVTWIPTHLSVESFIKAAKTLEFWDGLKDSLIMTVIPAGLQTFALALAGYGLARYHVPGKKFWMVLAVFIFLIPTQVTMIPRFLLFNTYQMIGTIWPIYLISALGQGVKSSVFLLIYYNFFNSYQAFDPVGLPLCIVFNLIVVNRHRYVYKLTDFNVSRIHFPVNSNGLCQFAQLHFVFNFCGI